MLPAIRDHASQQRLLASHAGLEGTTSTEQQTMMDPNTAQNFNVSQKYGMQMRKAAESQGHLTGHRSPSEAKLVTDRTATILASPG